eukprot:SAG11_NODE_1381_length_5078_cov_8.176341_2_plen_71_part_00
MHSISIGVTGSHECVCIHGRRHILAFPSEGIEGLGTEDEGAFRRELIYYGLADVIYLRGAVILGRRSLLA